MPSRPSFLPVTPPPGGPVPPGSAPLDHQRFREDPHGLYRELRREHGPVVPVLLEGEIRRPRLPPGGP
ncbi:hypothetical protein GCM10010376_01960 [Streptomyces violaceusniger]